MSKGPSDDRRRREDAARRARRSLNDLKEIVGQSGQRDLLALDEQARSYDPVAYKAYHMARGEAETAWRALDAMLLDAEGAFGRLASSGK